MKDVVYTRQALLQFEESILHFVRYRKNAHTTWYAFYEELENVYSIVYLANNKLIGHLLDISL